MSSLKQRRFGIELELSRKLLCINNSDRGYSNHWTAIVDILSTLYNDRRISRGWKLKVDTSCGGEVVSPILIGSEGLRQTSLICYEIEKYANLHKISAIDAECGLHIHFDAADMKPRQLSNLFTLLHHAEPIIYSMYPNRNPKYCAPIEINMRLASRFRDWTDVRDTWYRGENNTKNRKQSYSKSFINGSGAGDYYDGTRYHGFNIHCFWRQGTVEFRYGIGTLDPLHIRAYYEMCLSMVNTAISSKKISFGKSLKDYQFEDLLNHYSTNYRFRKIIKQLCKECSFSRHAVKLIMDMINKNRPWLLKKRPKDAKITVIDIRNVSRYMYRIPNGDILAHNGIVMNSEQITKCKKRGFKIVDVILDFSSYNKKKILLICADPSYQICCKIYYYKSISSAGIASDYLSNGIENMQTYEAQSNVPIITTAEEYYDAIASSLDAVNANAIIATYGHIYSQEAILSNENEEVEF